MTSAESTDLGNEDEHASATRTLNLTDTGEAQDYRAGMLFENKERTLEGGSASWHGPLHVPRPLVTGRDAGRHLLESMFEVYPEARRNGLATRLRSDEAEVHHSAFLELSLYSLFSRNGFSVVQTLNRQYREPKEAPISLFKRRPGNGFTWRQCW